MLLVLKKIGLSDKEIAVYSALLQLGSAPVRQIAVAAKINRGTTYDILKSLMKDGLVSYLQRDTKHFFTAEDPSHLRALIKKQHDNLNEVEKELEEAVPALQSLYKRGGEKPVVRYFEGERGIRTLLADVLAVMEKQKEKIYRVYSSSAIREHYYSAYPKFTEDRIKKKIAVRVIAMGPGGGTRGLDERRWLTQEAASPTYSLIYAGHVAHIALAAGGEMVGVIIENDALFASETMIFEALWKTLK